MEVRNDDPVYAGQLIDYTTTRWGHSLEARTGPDGLLRGFCWHRHGVRLGDSMIWSTEYGTAAGFVTEAQWMRDPDDMYRVAVKIVERRSSDGEILWSLDRA